MDKPTNYRPNPHRDRNPQRFRWPIYEPGRDPQELLRTETGYAYYLWFERIAICMDSGIPLEDARRTANEDLMRYLASISPVPR